MVSHDTASALIDRARPVVAIAGAPTHELRLALLASAGQDVKLRQLFRGAEPLDASRLALDGKSATLFDASAFTLPLEQLLWCLTRTSVLLFEPRNEPGLPELIARLARDCDVPRVVGLATQLSQPRVRERLGQIKPEWASAPVLAMQVKNQPLKRVAPLLLEELSAHLTPRGAPEGPLLFVPSRIDGPIAHGSPWRGSLQPRAMVRMVGLNEASMVEVAAIEPVAAFRFSQPVTAGVKVFTSGQTSVVERSRAVFELREPGAMVGDLYCFGTRVGRVRLEDDLVVSIEGPPGLVTEWGAPFCIAHRTGFHQPPKISFGRWA